MLPESEVRRLEQRMKRMEDDLMALMNPKELER
jgi:hypothetical protein